MHPATIHILLVEDNEGDIWLTMEALKQAQFVNTISVVRDGEEAISFLYKESNYKAAVTPDLILLDLNLPKVDGKEVLAKIKTDQALRQIPVVMLTTSSAEKDILESYKGHANCYITKPVDMEQFVEVVHSIKNFWFSIVQLPLAN